MQNAFRYADFSESDLNCGKTDLRVDTTRYNSIRCTKHTDNIINVAMKVSYITNSFASSNTNTYSGKIIQRVGSRVVCKSKT